MSDSVQEYIPANDDRKPDNILSRRDFLKLAATAFAGFIIRNINLDFGNTLDIQFVTHVQSEDVGNFSDNLKQCDIFIPEFIGFTPDNLKYFNNVSSGQISPEKISSDWGNGFFGQLLQELRGSKKLVKIIDIPSGHPLEQEYNELIAQGTDFTEAFTDHTISLYHKYQKWAAWERKREDLILTNLNNLGYTNIKVFMEYGTAHTRLWHLLNKSISQKRLGIQFPEKRFSFLPSDELKRRFWFSEDTVDPKKINPPSNRLLAEVVMEEMLFNWFYQPNISRFKNTASSYTWLRSVIDKFSNDEIASLWESQRSLKKSDPSLIQSEIPQSIREIIISKLIQKGVAHQFIENSTALL